jgi:hypothetical protein
LLFQRIIQALRSKECQVKGEGRNGAFVLACASPKFRSSALPDRDFSCAVHLDHILFEVKDWETYPVDPFLMRRISGMLYVIEAEWEFSPVEAELLASMIQGN